VTYVATIKIKHSTIIDTSSLLFCVWCNAKPGVTIYLQPNEATCLKKLLFHLFILHFKLEVVAVVVQKREYHLNTISKLIKNKEWYISKSSGNTCIGQGRI